MNSYRHPDDRAPDPDAIVADAVSAVGRRITRAKILLIISVMVVSMGVGGLLFWILTEIQFAIAGEAWVSISAGLGFGASLIGGTRLSDACVSACVRSRVSKWIETEAKRYDVPIPTLEEYLTAWGVSDSESKRAGSLPPHSA
jgi:hypothetical protein